MRDKNCVIKFGCMFALFLMCWMHPLYSQSYSNYPVNRSSPNTTGEDLNSAIRQIKANLIDMKHLLKNHEAEIRMIEGRLSHQESTFEDERIKHQEELQSHGNLIKATQFSCENKLQTMEYSIAQLDNLSKGTIADMRQLATQANESIVLLGQNKQKIANLEKIVEEQNQHFQHLENVIQSMMELIQTKDGGKSSSSNFSTSGTYIVQSGDALEKIARLHGISLKDLRAANPQIVNDRLSIGQQLNIPKS
ncbi:MAG: LysM peptidoglycan-binding domain-containing protein [Parachlamydiaceae bacterium]|nr:LysM peptidoglycan-binding domain-containing protein [Parachlamydiaceae bacterium]